MPHREYYMPCTIGLRNKAVNSFMQKHVDIDHKDDAEVKFKWSWQLWKTFTELMEVICINATNEHENLNSKMEFYNNRCNRLVMEQRQNSEQCNSCGRRFQQQSELKHHKRMFHETFMKL